MAWDSDPPGDKPVYEALLAVAPGARSKAAPRVIEVQIRQKSLESVYRNLDNGLVLGAFPGLTRVGISSGSSPARQLRVLALCRMGLPLDTQTGRCSMSTMPPTRRDVSSSKARRYSRVVQKSCKMSVISRVWKYVGSLTRDLVITMVIGYAAMLKCPIHWYALYIWMMKIVSIYMCTMIVANSILFRKSYFNKINSNTVG
jgi:hypothetical protein